MGERTSGGSTPLVIGIASAAALGGFLFGFDTAVINGAVLALGEHFQANDWLVGLSVSSALLASAVGALVAGEVASVIGRRRGMMLAAALFLISAVGSGFPVTIWDFMAWRIIGGVAVGAASVIVPAYIAEVSPAHLRGRLGSLQQLAIVVGIFVALLSNYAIAHAAGGASQPLWFGFEAWKWMFWMEAAPAAVYGVAAWLIPESPRFLVAKDRDPEAEAVLRRILGDAAPAKVADIRQSLVSDHTPHPRDLLGPYGLLPIVWVGVGLSLFQQLVGINVIFYYSTALWQAAGFSESHALVITTLTGLTNIVTTFVAIALVDRIGRKPLLLAGSVGMTLTLGAMAIAFATAPTGPDGGPVLAGARGWVALLAANAYVFAFGCSWGPVVWVLLGEMFSNRIRALALAVAGSAQWVANFAVSTTFPPMAGSLGIGFAYTVYTFFAAASIAFVALYVRETRGKELEQMTD